MHPPESLIQVNEAAAVAVPLRSDDDALAATQQAIATASLSFSIKVLTVNIHKGFTFFNRKFILHELREAVRTVGADVVFLQEVTGTHAKHESKVANYPVTPHYEFLADSIWPQFAYGRNAVYTNGHHGNAVLSKFPIIRFENRDVSISGPERRGLLHCVLEVPGRDTNVHVICVHLGLAESHRIKQLKMLCDLVHKDIPASAPVIAAGDFNDWRRRAHDVLAQGANMHEVFVQANGKAARTFPARFPLLQLDRIYVRNAIGHAPVVLPIKPWSHLSDHAPLAAEIEL
ncbi:endonuclease/exonuclease/phosphatase family protein [Polaromonas sp. SM01]|uniref:endonuclease/exonuclease/phosphatase family protein n=1 Tax=Polaromonas sp. SM01 TaxID=3085630 RepID=UPI0029822624|nr:endonuclease/exonuclease/phosphatase family protein [Polaromonas sp. SM01]MDW5441267.1 endonuclease/exonuclease/phosphatase family protein [Polaromonas sp. SM01]